MTRNAFKTDTELATDRAVREANLLIAELAQSDHDSKASYPSAHDALNAWNASDESGEVLNAVGVLGLERACKRYDHALAARSYSDIMSEARS